MHFILKLDLGVLQMSSSGDIEHSTDERIQNTGDGEEVFDPEENTGQEGEDDPIGDNTIPANMRDYLKSKLNVFSVFEIMSLGSLWTG